MPKIFRSKPLFFLIGKLLRSLETEWGFCTRMQRTLSSVIFDVAGNRCKRQNAFVFLAKISLEIIFLK